VLSFDALLREQDWTRLQRDDIADDGDNIALSLGVLARNESCKTGHNQGVVLLREAARLCAKALLAARPSGAKAFVLSEEGYVTLFHSAVADLQLPRPDNGLDWVPHCLRHGGASEFHRIFKASALDIKLRGRWESDKAVARYTKSHQLVALDARLSDEVHARAARFWADPSSRFRLR